MIDLISALNVSIELAKKAIGANEAMKTSEVKLIMADLLNDLADLKIKCSELITENHELKTKLKNKKHENKVIMSLSGDVYMENNDGPFCTTCWDQNTKRIRLKEEIMDFQNITGHKYICPVCQSHHKGNG